MANEPKLSVFVIQLKADNNDPTFYKRFQKSKNVAEEDEVLFIDMCGAFIRKLDDTKYHRNEKSGKAFTGQKTSGEGVLDIDFHPKRFVIEGTIDGGRFGEELEKSKLDDKTVREKWGQDDLLLRKFYFYLHTPLDSDKGILMIQSYANDSVTTDFLRFVKKFFASGSKGYKEASAMKHVPKSIIEEFKEHSIVKSFAFESNVRIPHLDEKLHRREEEEFIVTIKIQSKAGIRKKDYDTYMQQMSNGQFVVGRAKETFSGFRKRKATIKNEKLNKTTSFDLGRKFDIQPTIYLTEPKIKFIGKKIDFDSLKNFCNTVLKEIQTEVYGRNAVSQL